MILWVSFVRIKNLQFFNNFFATWLVAAHAVVLVFDFSQTFVNDNNLWADRKRMGLSINSGKV